MKKVTLPDLDDPEERNRRRIRGFTFLAVGIVSATLGLSLLYYGDQAIRNLFPPPPPPATTEILTMPEDPTATLALEETTHTLEDSPPEPETNSLDEFSEASSTLAKGFLGTTTPLKSSLRLSLYDLKVAAAKSKNPTIKNLPLTEWIHTWTTKSFDPKSLRSFVKAPTDLYAPRLFCPPLTTETVLHEFQASTPLSPGKLLIHARGMVQPDHSSRIRFHLFSAQTFLVIAQGKILLRHDGGSTESTSEWFTQTKSQPWRLDLLWAEEQAATAFHAYLFIEEEGTSATRAMFRAMNDLPFNPTDFPNDLPTFDNSGGLILRIKPVD